MKRICENFHFIPIIVNVFGDWCLLNCISEDEKINVWNWVNIQLHIPNAFHGSQCRQLIWIESEKLPQCTDVGNRFFQHRYHLKLKAVKACIILMYNFTFRPQIKSHFYQIVVITIWWRHFHNFFFSTFKNNFSKYLKIKFKFKTMQKFNLIIQLIKM